MSDKWSVAEDVGRDVVLCATALIPHDEAQGIAIAAGLAAVGYVINTAYAVEQAFKIVKGALLVR